MAIDFLAPSTATLNRIRDFRATQWWDPGRLLSRAMGERDEKSIVWDQVAVYPAGVRWGQAPPAPLYSGRPVVEAIDAARKAIVNAIDIASTPLSAAAR